MYILAALSGLMLFFNLFILESMLFFESAIMSLGILLAVVSVYFVLHGGIKGYLISLICMVLSVFCYQPTTAFFPPLAVLFLGVMDTEMDGWNNFWPKLFFFIRNAVPAAIIYTLSLLSNVVFLQLIPGVDGRFYGEARIFENIQRAYFVLRRFGRNNFGFMPDYIFIGFLLVFLFILVFNTIRAKKYLAMLTGMLSFALIFIAALLILLPMATDGWYVFPRSGVAMAGIGGLVLAGISLHSERINRTVVLIAMIFVLLISQRQIDIQLNSYANNHLDRLELALIGERLRAYEAFYGMTIERIYFGYDTPMEWFRPQLNNYGDLTISMWHVDWMPRIFLLHYLNRELQILQMTPEDLERIAEARAAHWFTGGRMVFEDDIVYLILNNMTTVP